MALFGPVGSSQVSVGSVTVTGKATPTVANVAMASAATEYSYALPAGCKAFYLKLRDPMADLQLTYTALGSGTTYISVPRGTWYANEELTASSITLYFQSPSALQVAEIEVWV